MSTLAGDLSRAAKTFAHKLISESMLTTPLSQWSRGEESDDSLVGEHSPFIRQNARKRYIYYTNESTEVQTLDVICIQL